MATEIIYSASGDLREEFNVGIPADAQNYKGESQLRGAIITRACRYATRYIDGKLKSAYPDQVPWVTEASVPRLITELANSIAFCWLNNRLHPGPAPVVKSQPDYCQQAEDTLQGIADGKIELPEIEAGKAYSDTYDAREGYMPIFDVDAVEDQQTDPNLLSDIADEREN